MIFFAKGHSSNTEWRSYCAPLLAALSLMLLSACATERSSPKTITVVQNTFDIPDLPTIAKPEIRVYFLDTQTDNGIKLCPAATTFVGKVTGMNSAGDPVEVEVELPTSVPVKAELSPGTSNTLYWIAVDKDGVPLEAPDSIPDPNPFPTQCERRKHWLAYWAYFDPFRNGQHFDSEWKAAADQPAQECDSSYDPNAPLKFIIGEEQFLGKRRLPEGASYKYTIVRMKRSPNNSRWIIDDDCPPLDPMIKILRQE